MIPRSKTVQLLLWLIASTTRYTFTSLRVNSSYFSGPWILKTSVEPSVDMANSGDAVGVQGESK
jgi:hypothetical protein